MPGSQIFKGRQMWKGMKMGNKKKKENKKGKENKNKKENKKGSKRSRELSPPTPPPTPPLSLGETAPAPLLDEDAYSGCPPEINMNFLITLGGLVSAGIITYPNNRLKTEESFKQSWDIGQACPISYEELFVSTSNPSEKQEVERYLNSAAENNYFDVPDPKERPDKLYQGFFVIYPEGQGQKDPIFERKPNFIKYVPLISKLGMGAVECHKFMTGSDLKFSKIKKANLFCHPMFQFYFITLEATDKLSGKEVTCQSRVVCNVDYDESWFTELEVGLVPIEDTFVEYFHRVED